MSDEVLPRWRQRGLVRPLLGVALLGAVVALWAWYPVGPLASFVPPEDAVPWSFSTDGRTLLTQAWRKFDTVPPARFWSVDTGSEQPAPFSEAYKCENGFYWPAGTLIADRRYDERLKQTTLKLWDVSTGNEWARQVGPGAWYPLHPVGRLTAFPSNSGPERHIQVWDVFARRQVADLKASRALALSADEKTIVTDNLVLGILDGPVQEQQITFWDLQGPEGPKERFRLRFPQVTVADVQYASHGKTFVVHGSDGDNKSVFKLCDAASGHELADLGVYPYELAFVLDGQILAATYIPRTQGCWVNCWDTMTGRLERSFQFKPPSGEYEHISLRAATAGRTVAVETDRTTSPASPPAWLPRWGWLSGLWSGDGRVYRQIHLIDVASGSTLATLPGSSGERYLFSPDGSRLAVKREEGGLIEIWEVPPRKPVTTLVLLSGCLVAIVTAKLWWRRLSRLTGLAGGHRRLLAGRVGSRESGADPGGFARTANGTP